MRRLILDVLEARWPSSLSVLTPTEQNKLARWFPHVRVMFDDLQGGTTFCEFTSDSLVERLTIPAREACSFGFKIYAHKIWSRSSR